MAVPRGAFDLVVAPGALAAFADEYPSLPAEYTSLFNIRTTQRAFEEVIFTTGLATTPVKPELEDVATDRPMQIGKVQMVVNSYGLSYEVSHELMEDDLYNVVTGPSSRFLAQSMRDAEERTAAAIWNNAFTTQQAYDGVSIVNTAHPLKGGGTYANRPASAQALSFTSLQASIERYLLLTNERGLRIKLNPFRLVVPVQLKWLADEILISSLKPFTAENTANVMTSGRLGLEPFAYTYLSSTTAWFVQAREHKFDFFWRERPNMDRDFDKKRRAAIFLNFARWGNVAWDWRGIDGSTGA